MLNHKLVAILHADVAGYCDLMSDSPQATVRKLQTHRRRIERLIGAFRGRLVDWTGDNFLAEFPSAVESIRCAIESQRAIAAENGKLAAEQRMQFRIGSHLGEVIVDETRICGDGVNIAARLQRLAEPGGIVLSDRVHQEVRKHLEFQTTDLGELELQGIEGPVRAYSVVTDPEVVAATADWKKRLELAVLMAFTESEFRELLEQGRYDARVMSALPATDKTSFPHLVAEAIHLFDNLGLIDDDLFVSLRHAAPSSQADFLGVEQLWRAKSPTTESVDLTPPRQHIPATPEYQRLFLSRFGSLRRLGLFDAPTVPFEANYVVPRLTVKPHITDLAPGHGVEARKYGDASIELSTLFLEPPRRHLVLVGGAGSGKTALLRRVGSQLLSGGSLSGLSSTMMPVFLELRHWQRSFAEEPFHRFVQSEFKRQFASRLPNDLGRSLWRRGHLLLLMDGFDEMQDESTRTVFWEHLLASLVGSDAMAIRCVISERSPGSWLEKQTCPDFLTVELREFSRVQSSQFVQNFAAARTTTRRGEHARVGEVSAQLLRMVGAVQGNNLRHQVLFADPHLLTILCSLHFDRACFDGKSSSIYKGCMEHLLGPRGGSREREALLSYETSCSLLERIAWGLCSRARLEINSSELDELIGRRQLSPSPREIRDWLEKDVGLLTKDAGDTYRFAHQCFRDYFAAVHASKGGRATVQSLAAAFGDRHWGETVSLAIELAGKALLCPLIEGLLTTGKLVTHEPLVMECVDLIEQHDRAYVGDALIRIGAQLDDRRAVLYRLVSYLGKHESLTSSTAESIPPNVHASGELARTSCEMLQPSSGAVLVEACTRIRFVGVPGGQFLMGSDDIDVLAESPECGPAHQVEVSPYWISETPVTNQQFAPFVEQHPECEPDYWRRRRFGSPAQPVVGVSWKDARAFANWLAAKSGWAIDLPTEAQWEFSARGTDCREYPWGNEPPDRNRACYDLGAGDAAAPIPVGMLADGMGPFGTLDQAGNVWEWCRDTWSANAYANGPRCDPDVQSGATNERVLRGGSFLSPPRWLRAAFRCRYSSDWRIGASFGFRLVLNARS